MFIGFALLVSLSAVAFQQGADDDAKLLIDSIEAVQRPVKDFRCEYEGTIRYFDGEIPSNGELGKETDLDVYSGIFIWKTGGDTYCDSIHRWTSNNRLIRESLAVRTTPPGAEFYERDTNAPVGIAVINDPKTTNSYRLACLGYYFLIDELKREVAESLFTMTVTEEVFEGRPVKVLSHHSKKNPDFVVQKNWIDLRRNGHVVRRESYSKEKRIRASVVVELAKFPFPGGEAWMPVKGIYKSYAKVKDKKPMLAASPTVLETLYVIRSSMEFNRNPGPEVFKIDYKPGTPVTDHRRQLTYEFGQQKLAPRPSKAQVETMLVEEVRKAEAHKAELVVADLSNSTGWVSWTVSGILAVLLGSTLLLRFRNR